MKLLSWNLNARRAAREQVAAVARRQPDVVALQEVTETTVGTLRRALIERGLPFAVSSFELAESPSRLVGPRRYGLLIAARVPVEPVLHDVRVPWPERVLAAKIHAATGPVLIYTTHVAPGSSNAWVKVEILEGLYEGLAKRSSVSRILCGDFNCPREERRNGEVITWGQEIPEDGKATVWGRWKGDTGQRWDSAERNVLLGLKKFDLADVYRALHGYGKQEFSWYVKRKGRSVGRRFDHIFASASLKPISCVYIHAFRDAGLSDHSAIEATFAIQE